MRFFKHGDSLAVVLPDRLRKAANVTENDDYEFFELGPGLFALVEKRSLEAQVKKTVIAELVSRLGANGSAPASAPAQSPSSPSPSASLPPSSFAPASSMPSGPSPSFEPVDKLLQKQGFAVISNESEARLASSQMEAQIKGKQIFGVRGFDKKFYLVTDGYLNGLSGKLLKLLAGKEIQLKELAAQTKSEEEGCLAVLQVLKEQGEVIEKRRGLFKAI